MKLALSVLALGALLALSACGDSDETAESSDSGSTQDVATETTDTAAAPLSAKQAADEIVAELNTIATQLESVTSEETAKAAAVVIDKSQAALDEISKTFSELSDVSKATAIAAVAGELGQIQQRIGAAMVQIQKDNPQLFETLSKTINELPSLN
ncbi:MAG: hypothetical protein AAFY02_12950 [Pseudomonadota bacterium]